jgi:hypothetical protein
MDGEEVLWLLGTVPQEGMAVNKAYLACCYRIRSI